jgi:hypothetical protein
MRGRSVALVVFAIVATVQVAGEQIRCRSRISRSLAVVRPLPASPRCRQPQQQQATDDDADHHDRAEGTPSVVVFAVFNEQRNHEYKPTDRSAIRSSSSGRFLGKEESVFEGDVDKLAAAGITRGCNPSVNDQYCPGSNVTRGQMAAFLVRDMGYPDDVAVTCHR